jgi:hypothetical protein
MRRHSSPRQGECSKVTHWCFYDPHVQATNRNPDCTNLVASYALDFFRKTADSPVNSITSFPLKKTGNGSTYASARTTVHRIGCTQVLRQPPYAGAGAWGACRHEGAHRVSTETDGTCEHTGDAGVLHAPVRSRVETPSPARLRPRRLAGLTGFGRESHRRERPWNGHSRT